MDDLPRKKDKKPLYREVGAGWWQKLDPQTSCWFFAHEDGRVQWEAPEGIDHSRVLPQNLHSKTDRTHHGSSRSSGHMPSESAMRACEACAGRHRPHTCGRARGNNHRGATKAKAKAKAKKRPAVPKSPIKRKSVADPVEGCEACAGRHRPHTCHRRTNRAQDSDDKRKVPKLQEYTASFVLRGRIETVPAAPASADDGAEGARGDDAPSGVLLSGTWFDSDNTDFATTEMRLFEREDGETGADAEAGADERCPPSGGVWLGAMAIPARADGAASADEVAAEPQMIQDRMALRFAPAADDGAVPAAAAAADDGAPPELVVEGEGVTSAGRYVIHGRCAPDEANARAWVLEVTRTYTSDAPEPPPMPDTPDAAEFVEASMHAPMPALLNKEDLYAGNDAFWRRQ